MCLHLSVHVLVAECVLASKFVLVGECILVVKSRREAACRWMDSRAVDGPVRHGWTVMCGRKQQQADEDEGIDVMWTGARASANKEQPAGETHRGMGYSTRHVQRTSGVAQALVNEGSWTWVQGMAKMDEGAT